MKLVYDSGLINLINLFENFSGVKVKDSFLKNSKVYFVVNKGDLWKAVGKKGSKIRRIENLMMKKIGVVEFDDDVKKFANNLIYPIKAENIEFKDDILIINVHGAGAKGLLIGRGGKNLRELKEILSRYFKLNSVKVV